MTLITKDVTTVEELKTLSGQGNKAIVMYDVSTGEPKGLDVEVLMGMDASISEYGEDIGAINSSIGRIDSSVAALNIADITNYAKAIESIAHNATAPSPIIPTGATKTYEFSTGGDCTMFTAGAQVVEKGDMMTVSFTAPSIFVRTFVSKDSLKVDDLTLADTERALAEAINTLYGKIITLEAILTAAIYDAFQVDTLDVVKTLNIFGTTNMILIGTAAPAVTPDFVGQTFINTVAGTTYTAKGVTSSSDWKQTSN
jgi:hypothetical protein